MHCSEPGGSVAVADGTTDRLHHFVDAIVASRAQMELKLNCTAQRMLGRCRLRLKTTTAQGAWVFRLLSHLSRMSMISILVFASDDEIRQLLAEPERIEDFISEERTSTDLDKAWH